MKRKFALLLILAIALICVVVACKPVTAQITKIEIMEEQEKYSVGETINFNNVKIKVYYDDNTTKVATVGELNATVKNMPDMTKEGNTSYTIEYQGFEATKEISLVTYTILNYQAPDFWFDYQNNIKGSSFEDNSKFIDATAIYEVGNLNKFIFVPKIEGIETTNPVPTTINQSPKTTTKVYIKDDNGVYGNALTEGELITYVAIENNTYQFTKEAAGKIFKLEISLDKEAYIIHSTLSNTTITIEFLVVDNGYNAYDQDGLAVMTDAFKAEIWEEILKKNTDNPLQLEADDKPLYQYVGQVDVLILHGSILLDAEKLPSAFFWKETDTAFATAKGNLSPIFENKVNVIGSLKDGTGEGNGYDTINYIDNTITVADKNMQKSLYATTCCSLSGNYFDIKVPTAEQYNNTERRFYTAVWYEAKNSPNFPISHWSIFKTVKSRADLRADVECNLYFKNCSMTGNQGKTENNTPAGMMMVNSAVDELVFNNVIGSSFFTNLTQDNYLKVEDKEFSKNINKFIKSKLFDSYSNMITTWRGTFEIVESVLQNAGGPLFIMMDGNRTDGTTDDSKGPNILVDSKSKLESYATGTENWFVQNNAQALVMSLQTMDPLFTNYFSKTILTTKSNKSYINVIAAIIPDPADIFNPSVDNIEICGSYTQYNEDATDIVASYAMHNPVLQVVKQLPVKTLVFQSGNNFAILGQNVLLNTNNVELSQDYLENGTNSTIAQWRSTATNTLGIYMTADPTSSRLPYFGVVIGFNDVA